MTPSSSCPLPDELQRLLDEQLSDAERRSDLESHIETCSQCQAQLARMTPLSVAAGLGAIEPTADFVPALVDPTQSLPDPARALGGNDTSITRDADTSPRQMASQGIAPSLPGYELLEKIGQGGMGVVYKARQIKLNRIVALKMILAGQLATPADVQRFYAEAESAGHLDHPGIVPVYEVGEHHGQHYFSMAFIEGESLARRVATGPLPPREAATLVQQIATAMAYAHDRGVIHRDLKPANILLQSPESKSGDSHLTSSIPKITDFGLAKRLESDSELTATGQILGTPSYMSPEQATGQTQIVGPSSDIYSLGAILYCLLTSRPPFQSANVLETLKQVAEQDPVSPRQLNAEIPLDLETIVLKCLEKSPAQRYATAADLSAELTRFLAGEPIHARPVSPPERLWRWCRRNPAISSLTATVALVLLVGICVSTYFAIEADARARDFRTQKTLADASAETATRNAQDAERARERANEKTKDALAAVEREHRQKERADEKAREALAAVERERKETERADAKASDAIAAAARERNEKDRADESARRALRHLYAAEMNLAQRDWEMTDIRNHMDRLERTCPERTDGHDFRGFEWYYWRRLCASHLLELDGEAAHIAFSPDGKHLASTRGDHTITIWDTVAERTTQLLNGHTDSVISVAFGADGNRLASAGYDKAVIVWNVLNGKELLTLKGHTGRVRSVAFSADGRRLASASDDLTATLWDASNGMDVLTLKRDKGYFVNMVALNADASRLALVMDDCIKLWDTMNGQETMTLKGHTDRIASAAFSPDGKRLASTGYDKVVNVWDMTNGQLMLSLRPNDSDYVPSEEFRQRGIALRSVTFSPDGKLLASVGLKRSVIVWDTTSGKVLLTLRGHSDYVRSIAFSADGKQLASAALDSKIKFWDATSGQETLTFKGHNDRVTSVAFSPDGKRLASGSHDNLVKVWDVATGQERFALDAQQPVECVRFDADGRHIASGGWNETMKLWNAFTGKEGNTLKIPTPLVPPPFCAVKSVVFHKEGKRLVSASFQSTIREWDVLTGESRTLSENANYVELSPNGQLLALGEHTNYHGVRVLDLSNGESVFRRDFHDGVMAVAFSSDGRRLAAGIRDGTVKVLNATNGQEMHTLKGHYGIVFSVAFSPDGQRLASASDDNTVKVWDTASGRETLTLKGHADSVLSVAFSPAGNQIASGSKDGTVKVWDARPWTPELRKEQQAVCLLRFLRGKSMSQPALLDAIARDQSISEPVRALALQFARGESMPDEVNTSIPPKSPPEMRPQPDASSPTTKPGIVKPADVAQPVRRGIVDWVLANSGSVTVRVTGRDDKVVRTQADMPSDDFGVKSVRLSSERLITDTDLQRLGQLSELRELHLIGCSAITDLGLQQVRNLKGLQALSLSKTQVTDAGLECLLAMTDLQSLGLYDTKVTDAGLAKLRGLTAMQQMWLYRSGITAAGLGHLKDMKQLRTLYLDGNQVTAEGIANLKQLAGLRGVNVMGNNVDDESVRRLAELDMTNISILQAPVTDEGLQHLVKVKNLNTLLLSQTKVTQAGVDSFRKERPDCQVTVR